ncbi:hypothetical protein ILUMI_16103 [Ignelater luminosus]|uniref:PiggyBac transposable element-derived protein domain-containing protein n=1 Tax=Ignelater luminosus TaxID=2038154 RepID=A0A8K0G376_IGNLU|nr:hypothetical protein ILUMI_16103 [Ignelater luminosus]
MEETDEGFDSSSSSEDEVVDTPGRRFSTFYLDQQYIRSKRHRFEITFFVLADVETDYVLDFIIYAGATTNLDEIDKKLSISGAVITGTPVQSWQSTLMNKKQICVRSNKKGMPELEKKLKQGEVMTQHTDKMMVLKYSVECITETMKWHKKVFFHLVDLAVTNFHAMYKEKAGSHMSLADFQLELLKEHRSKKDGRPSGNVSIRLVGRRFPKLIPAVPGGKNNS